MQFQGEIEKKALKDFPRRVYISSVKFQGVMMNIKDKYLKISLCLVVLLMCISFFPVASASSPPTIPNVFEGNLITEGASAPAGTIISAYIDSRLVGRNSIAEPGKYKIAVSGTEQDNGKEITFKLGPIESEPVSVTYQQGALPAKLDLSFKGDFVNPIIESFSASPAYILNDEKDLSVISVKVSDASPGVSSVTVDLSPVGGRITSLEPGNDGIYTCHVNSTLAGSFNFPVTVKDSFGNEVSIDNGVSITALKEEELITKYGGSDRVFSAEEIKNLVNENDISRSIKYAVLAIYFADGWDRI
jgi:hypothetical protein